MLNYAGVAGVITTQKYEFVAKIANENNLFKYIYLYFVYTRSQSSLCLYTYMYTFSIYISYVPAFKKKIAHFL